ncbi:hypothetical protein POTOM_021519 [Populus tomentosa]|uniref:Fibronectin type III-like domain-containing protein n=1 Tax=Populus tomentosa TaxID=118781 RepID=A0A8X7ZXL3_POPTO|nr:hypothetical protein POTOM_021519 [Populus tomentosa]
MRPQNLRFFTFTIFTVLVLQADSTQPPFSCDSSNPSTKTFPFCKTTLPISQRATDLVARLTLEEKISQLVNSAQPIPRLGIPGYQWWSEALHGVACAGPGIRFNGTIKRATSFPQVILSAASFDANQWYRISQVTAQDLADTYQPPFKSCVEEGRASGIMCAYNRVNGIPNCADSNFLSQTARAQWGFDGYIASGCDAVSIIHDAQGYAKTPEDAVVAVLKAGCDSVQCSSDSIDGAVNVAKGADHVVLIMGLDDTQEKEGLDRRDLVLPGKQQELIISVAKAAKNPVVLVLLSGGPVDISFAKNDKNIGSILWAGCPGDAGAIALAEIIFGDHNPGGKLPMTWYPQEFVKVPMTDMRMRPETSSGYPGRTYRFYKGPTVFEFGYGLSYSKYTYELSAFSQNKLYLDQSSTMHKINNFDSVLSILVSELGTEFCEHNKFPVRIEVKNHDEMAGKHPVLLFARQTKQGNGRPRKQLVGFHSVQLSAGERAEIEFEVSPCEHLSRTNEDGLMVMEEGTHFLVVEGQEYRFPL